VKHSIQHTRWSTQFSIQDEALNSAYKVKHSIQHTRWSTQFSIQGEALISAYKGKHSFLLTRWSTHVSIRWSTHLSIQGEALISVYIPHQLAILLRLHKISHVGPLQIWIWNIFKNQFKNFRSLSSIGLKRKFAQNKISWNFSRILAHFRKNGKTFLFKLLFQSWYFTTERMSIYQVRQRLFIFNINFLTNHTLIIIWLSTIKYFLQVFS
jgi:hypothetical protein